MSALLEGVVKARLNVLISADRAGKTTLLTFCRASCGHERIVTIEDAAELQLKQEHVVRLETGREPRGHRRVAQRDLSSTAPHAARPDHRRRGARPKRSTCCRR